MKSQKELLKNKAQIDPQAADLLAAQEATDQRVLKLEEAARVLKGNHHFQVMLGLITELKDAVKEECTRPEHSLEILRWYQAEHAILDNILLRLSFEGEDPNEEIADEGFTGTTGNE